MSTTEIKEAEAAMAETAMAETAMEEQEAATVTVESDEAETVAEATGEEAAKEAPAEETPASTEKSARRGGSPELRYFARLALTLFAITAAVALMLGGVNALTAQRILENAAKDRAAAMAAVLPGYTISGESVEVGETSVTQLEKDGAPAWCVSVSPKGFGGEIKMVVSVLQDEEGILRVGKAAVTSHAETMGDPSAESFLGQYEGLTAGVTLGGGENGVDAMTGATVSSTAVTRGINTALDAVACALEEHLFEEVSAQ